MSAFITYENKTRKRARIHLIKCSQVKKNGGTHKYRQGKWVNHDAYPAAKGYIMQLGFNDIGDCPYCKPGSN